MTVRQNFVRSRSSRLFVPRGFAEGEVWAARSQFVPRHYFSMMANSFIFGSGGGGPGTPISYYLDTDGSNGDGSIGSPWNSLENARTGIIALHASLVADDVTPTLICTGATDDTTAVTNTWPTSDTTRYLTIKVPDADRKVVWNAGHYTLALSVSGGATLSLSANSIRLEGLQLTNTNATGNEKIIELTALGGEFVCESCLMIGVNGSNSTGIYVRTAGIGGTLVIRNTFVLSTVHGYLLGGGGVELLTGSQVYVYNTAHWGSGTGGESVNVYFAASGSGRIARIKNCWNYAQVSNPTVTNGDVDDQATNSKGGIEVTHFVAPGTPGDWRLVAGSSNVDSGTDLSAVGADQWQFDWDASLYTRPYNGTWDRGFHEYRP